MRDCMRDGVREGMSDGMRDAMSGGSRDGKQVKVERLNRSFYALLQIAAFKRASRQQPDPQKKFKFTSAKFKLRTYVKFAFGKHQLHSATTPELQEEDQLQYDPPNEPLNFDISSPPPAPTLKQAHSSPSRDGYDGELQLRNSSRPSWLERAMQGPVDGQAPPGGEVEAFPSVHLNEP